MMSVPVSQEWSELNSRSKKLQTLVCANRSKMVDEIAAAAAGINHDTCHRILSDDLNMSRVAQHSVPRIKTQDQCDDRMSICSEISFSSVSSSYTNVGRLAEWPTATILREDVDMCTFMRVSCNME
jgi:hypothetical protein